VNNPDWCWRGLDDRDTSCPAALVLVVVSLSPNADYSVGILMDYGLAEAVVLRRREGSGRRNHNLWLKTELLLLLLWVVLIERMRLFPERSLEVLRGPLLRIVRVLLLVI